MDLNKYSKIIIYQFGKVGSTTLEKTFQKYARTIHTHYLDATTLGNQPVLVVNVMRNLYDRNISAFFENFDSPASPGMFAIPRNGFHIKEYPLLRTDERSLHGMTDFFRDRNINKLLKIRYTKWYSYFNQQLGINVFSEPFDREKKYGLFQNGNVDVLVLRFEDLKEWEGILNGLFGTDIKLVKGNITNEKKKYTLYQEFKQHYVYSQEEIDLINGIDFMQHFYTPEERYEYLSSYVG